DRLRYQRILRTVLEEKYCAGVCAPEVFGNWIHGERRDSRTRREVPGCAHAVLQKTKEAVIAEDRMAYPNELKYTREHEWVKLDGKAATVGITNYAQEQLGDIVFVELPKVGAEVAKGKSFGTVESVKSVSEIFAPVSRKVIAVNEVLATVPEKINNDAHGSWM